MNKKRTLLTVVALILVCVLSIMGTAAYLKTQTTTVTNTFVAAGGGDLIKNTGALTLVEHEATKIMQTVTDGGGTKEIWTGKYEIKTGAATTQAITYDIMPGMVVPKDPYVTITQKTSVPAYLYIEVINNLSFSTKVDGKETLVIDPEHWLAINVDGRDIYVYTNDGATPAIVTSDVTANIIKDDKFTVNKDVEPTTLDADETLKFQAFLAQASIGEVTDPAAIFTTCF